MANAHDMGTSDHRHMRTTQQLNDGDTKNNISSRERETGRFLVRAKTDGGYLMSEQGSAHTVLLLALQWGSFCVEWVFIAS